MRPDLVWTPKASDDLLDIYVFIGLDDPAAAERLYSAIEAKALLLVSRPQLGVRRPEIAPTARMLIQGVYLALYETHPDNNDGLVDEVRILRIVHGHRDLSRIF
jgi:toxin ParE1/3/4